MRPIGSVPREGGGGSRYQGLHTPHPSQWPLKVGHQLSVALHSPLQNEHPLPFSLPLPAPLPLPTLLRGSLPSSPEPQLRTAGLLLFPRASCFHYAWPGSEPQNHLSPSKSEVCSNPWSPSQLRCFQGQLWGRAMRRQVQNCGDTNDYKMMCVWCRPCERRSTSTFSFHAHNDAVMAVSAPFYRSGNRGSD